MYKLGKLLIVAKQHNVDIMNIDFFQLMLVVILLICYNNILLIGKNCPSFHLYSNCISNISNITNVSIPDLLNINKITSSCKSKWYTTLYNSDFGDWVYGLQNVDTFRYLVPDLNFDEEGTFIIFHILNRFRKQIISLN